MNYLLFFEDGEVRAVTDLSEQDASPCSWPTVVRLSDIGSGLIMCEKLNFDGEWIILEDR